MFLFIFESIGTSELILIGVVALIFLGPRKMPEYARKLGKLMNEFRSTTNEFKETWEREVNFDEEAKALRLDDDDPTPVARIAEAPFGITTSPPPSPTITEADPSAFGQIEKEPQAKDEQAAKPTSDDINDRKNWL